MELDHYEINKSINKYFPFKPGQKLTAPETKDIYYVFKYTHKDKITISITTFKYISIGAKHYYCKIDYCPYYLSEKTDGSTHEGGYLGGIEGGNGLTINFVRKITKKEREEDPKRWDCLDAGEYTTCFNSIEDIKKLLIPFLNKHFKEDEIFYFKRTRNKYFTFKNINNALKELEDKL